MKSMPIFTGLTQVEMTTNPEWCPLYPTQNPNPHPSTPPSPAPCPLTLLISYPHPSPCFLSRSFANTRLPKPLCWIATLLLLTPDEGLAGGYRKQASKCRERDKTVAGSSSGHHLSKTQRPVQNTVRTVGRGVLLCVEVEGGEPVCNVSFYSVVSVRMSIWVSVVRWCWGGGQWRWGWRSSGPCPSSLGPSKRRGKGQVYRACVLSSMGSPRVSCWVSLSGGRLPFSVARRSDRPLIRGNSMKSYRRAPMAPPIMGPTQYTCWQQKQDLSFTSIM